MRKSGMKYYIAYGLKRKNAEISTQEVTVIEKNNNFYHVGLAGNHVIPQLEKPFEENHKIYVYAKKEEVAIELIEKYLKEVVNS